jgi:hypothetical protein
LDHVEIAAPQIGEDGVANESMYKLLIDEDEDSEEIEQARKDNELVRKRVMERIASGNHLRLNKDMREKLELKEGSAPSNEGQAGTREARKRKQEVDERNEDVYRSWLNQEKKEGKRQTWGVDR